MANPIQQQSLQRKLIYIGLILVLFTLAGVFRKYGVEAQASQLSLREQDRADVQLTDAAVRLSLTGSRGVAVCLLWATAIDKQKKNQWNELELLVRSVTKLQPHFITPWLFQSWNLAYNVSVESDRERDQYFYISRGIELLYQGERQNKNHPDLRFAMGHYTMNKVAQGDKKNVLQSLFQMSCIDPRERDPQRFRAAMPDGRERSLDQGRRYLAELEKRARDNPSDTQAQVRLDEARARLAPAEKNFEEFCRKHPQLVRRLREKVRCTDPDQVVRFLAENQKVPSLYQDPRPDKEKTPLKADPGDRFPLLPPPRPAAFDPDALTDVSNIDQEYVDYLDAFLVANAWFAYAQEALPRPDAEWPGKSEPITDRTRQRTPKMTTLIFRMFPARAMSYVAERLKDEGWFDSKGWPIDDPGTARPQKWFPDLETLEVGTRHNWGVDFWGKAHRMWQSHGEANHLLLPPEDLANLKNEAKKFQDAFGIKPEDRARQIREEDVPANLRAAFKAHQMLRELEYYNTLTNFRHFYFTSMVEAKKETVQARKNFYEAERLRPQVRWDQALAKYEQAIPAWRQLLEDHPDFQRDEHVQEETYEIQAKYLNLVKRARGAELKQKLALQSCWGHAAAASSFPALAVSARVLLGESRRLPDVELVGPFDGNTSRGEPFIRAEIAELARNRNPTLRTGTKR